MLAFLELRAIPGVEIVKSNKYCRTVRHVVNNDEYVGWVTVSHDANKQALIVNISCSLAPASSLIKERIRHLFDLDCNPQSIFKQLAGMNTFKPGLCVLGTRVPGCYDAFEMSVRAILGQQITVKAASTLAGRIVKTLGTPLTTDIESLTHLFPSTQEMLGTQEVQPLENTLGALGIISSRSRTIKALAQALEAGELTLKPSANTEEEINTLLSLKGIGSWTAQYIAMRTMQWPDSFLETDVGVKHALAPLSPKEMLELSKDWQPWRSYATVNLWNSLSRL